MEKWRSHWQKKSGPLKKVTQILLFSGHPGKKRYPEKGQTNSIDDGPMKTILSFLTGFVLLLSGVVSGQQVLNLQESPPASGLFTARVDDAYSGTGLGNGKVWIFNAEANDRVVFVVRTGVRANSYPVLRVTNSGGGVIAEVSGSADGRCVLNGLVLASPGVYQVSVYSNNTASAFTMQGLLGRGIDLEGEPNDLAVQANPVTATMQAGGFRAGVAGILDGNVDWYDLGVLSSGNGVNLSLQTPTGSTLAGAATAVELYKDDETSPLARAMGGALVQTLAASGHYRMAVRMPGLDGGNLHFHGGQSVDLGNPVALQLTDSQTIEFWIRPDDFNSRQNPYAKAYAGEGTMTLETDGTVNYFYGTGGGNNSPYQTFNTGAALRVGQWQHIALVRDFTSTPKQLRWYIDGQLVAQTEASYFPAAASSLPLTLGTGYAGDFRGSLDELRLWNVARSAADIASNLGHPLSATESGLVAYFAFSEGSGTTVSDATANALSGTISGGPVWEGSPSATLASYVTQGIGAIYLLSVNVSDTVAPEVTDFQSIPTSGYVFDGSTPAPYNMTAQRGNNGQSFVYTLVGDSGGGNIWGTDTYTVDSYLGRAAVHAGVLAPGEMGAVRVTIRPGMGSYLGTSRFGTGSYGYGAYDSSYVIERYRPAAPFTLNGLYSSLYIGFSKAIRESTLAGGVTLVSAGPDGVFGTADDRSYPLSLVRFTPDNRAIFSLGNAILSPGLHRLTVAASVADRSGNTLAAPYSQNFTVAALAHYVNEKGDDNTQATATSLSTHVAAGTPDGSFADFGRTTATAGWPFDVELADFDGDGKLDAVVSHLGSVDGLSIFPGNGDKTFGTPLTFFGLGDEPYHIALLDIDKDGKTDIAVTVAGGRFVALFHNDSTPGHISFTRLGNVAVGDWPMRLAVGDINGDGWPDLVCSNNGTDTGNGGYSVSVLLNDQHGGFTETKIGLGLSPRIHPQAIGLGDFNKDGKLDLVVGDMDNGKRLAIFLGNGDGTFGAPSFLDTPDRPTLTDFAIADFNHDGNLDIATMATDNYNDSNGTYDFGVFAGNGDGTFQPRTSINMGYGYYNYFVKTVDVNGDGWPDLVFGGNDHVTVATNRADGSIGFDLMRRNWGNTYGVAVGDLNGDGLPELVITDHDENVLRVLDGNAVSPLAADDPATGLHHGYGRGFLSDNTDLDYWSFTAKRGEMLTVAADLSGISGSSGLAWYVYDEVGNQLTYFYNGNNWSGETPPLAIPRDGTYYLRVSPWYDYRGEYRFRVSLAPPGTQLERETNNWLGESNALAFTLSGHSLSATVAGYLASYDNSGDFFNLGNLAAGTQVSATLRLPTTSTLAPALTLFKADGSQITPTILTPTQLVYTLQPGDESTYHVRVSATDGKGVMAEYFLDLALSDVVPPSIVSDSLPAEGSTVTFVGSTFTLGFSEDMLPTSVNDMTSYTLLASGGDGTFNNGNEVAYTIRSPGYGSGLTATYFLPDGPLQPDTYRLVVSTGLKDKANNNMAAPHVRTFTVAGLPGYVLENRSNTTQATATSLSTHVAAGTADGSFADFGRTTATAGWPFDVELADFDGDGKLDAVVSHLGSVDGLSIFPGNGDRTFGTPLTFFGLGDEPYHIALLDIDKDGKTDIAVTVAGGRFVALFHNNSTPGHLAFTRLGNVAVGDWPMRLAVGDVNGDGWPDLVCSNNGTDAGNGGYSVSVLLNDQHGGFTESKIGLGLSPRIRPEAIGLGDFNKDGKLDLVVGDMDNGKRVAIFLGNGDGTFGAPSFLDTPDRPTLTDFAIADFNQDGNLDIATMATDNYNDSNGTYDFGVFAGNGDGTFQPRTSINMGYGYYNYFVKTVDVNGDGWPDLVFGGNDHVTVATNRANGSIGFDLVRRNWGSTYGVAMGDLNGDGVPELVITDHDDNLLRVLDGNAVSPLAADDPATGLQHGYGRGFLADNTDLDYWSFTAKRGEMLTVAADLSGISGSSGLAWYVYDEVGNQLTYFYNGNNWSGETPPLAIPRDGTYYLRVSPWYDYRGEYRFRVSLAPPGTQLERETNNWLGESNGLAFTLSSHSLSATAAGYLASYDNSGDFFNLGNLAVGTQVSATLRLPTTSTLAPALTLFKADGSQVTPTILTPTQLVYTLQPGDESTYHVRVSATAGKGLMAEYFLDLALSDTMPPSIIACTLPTGTTGGLLSAFNLSFNKDMLASTVNNAANYSLVWAGPDGTFATGDDEVFAIAPAGYGNGLSNSYSIVKGPLPPGNYQLRVAGLRDTFNNAQALGFERDFSISQVGGYQTETEPNNSPAAATPLVFNTDIPGYLTANGRGVLVSSEDIEYWTFEAQAGDVLAFETNLPYEPSGYGLSWRLTDADGGVVFDRGITSADIETHAPYTLTKTGAYLLRIDDWYGVRSEHRFRVSLLRGLAHEIEPNDSIATATPLTFTHSGGIDSASVAGMIGTSSGLDYYDLGSLAAGNTVFLTVRRPTGSILGPIVSLYSQAGTLMAETNGVAGDDSAEVQIGESGHYYALVRASYGTAGLNSDYILDARVLPTSAVNFPNLRVTRLDEITLPSLHTGDTIPLSYEVSNVGNLVTNASTWTDRVVLSTNNVYGDADDLQLALITHHGALEPGGSYSVNQTLTLPDGLPGTYYLLVKTDSSNSVDEILQEGDNTTCTVNPFVVGLRDYPDLVVENLAVSGPDPSGNWQLGWNLANRGSGVAAPGHSTRVQVLNTSSGQVVVDQNLPAGGVSDPLAAGATLPQSQSINAAAPGYYVVTVSADAGNVLYEYAAGGHALAEQNSVQTNFQVYHYYDISVAAAPAAGGAVTGAGSAREGLPVTVIATPNTSSLPYAFLNWTEDGTFVSSQATYTFTPTRNRNLLAVFGLPQFQVAAVASPVGYGSVTGSGNFPLNTTVVLTPVATAGYVFDHWQENAVNIGTSVPLQFSVAANRSLVAVFRELVPAHVVTLACQPPGVGALAGGGTYTNGQTLAVSAASRVEQGDLEFLFQRFELNGQFFSSGNALNKTFSTLDAATMNFVAVYQQRSLKPVVGGVACSRGVLVPIAPDVTFTVTFDRDMNPAIAPVLALLSGNASAVPVVPAGGTWLDARNFRSLPVAFGASNGGGYTLRVSGGSDLLGHTMDPDASFGFTMDALAPVNPVLVVSATTPTSATLSWADYEAPVDLSGFRYFLEDHTFTSVAGLSAKGGGSTGARSNVFSGLLPDHEYFAAVTAVDVAGNSDPAVSAVRIFLRSQTPPPVTPLLTTTGVDSAHLDWSAYDTSALVGFAGFRVFAASTPLTDITGLTPLAGLPASANSYDLTGLDRTQTHYFAVIGYNVLNQFNPSVTAVMWSDPLAGTLRGDLAIGGAAAVIPVFANLVIDGGATLTIAPGSTLRFADGTGIEVRNGRILANGTDLLPIHFTAAADDGAAGVPLRGAWAGITLGSAAAPVSEISRAWLRYGSGLRITAGSPLVTRLYAIQNAGGGLDVSGSGAVAATGCYLAFNENGLRAMESATVHLHQSVILNNTTVNALQQGSATLDAASNWWGSADADVIAAGLSGSVGAATPLAGEPVLGSAVAAASGVTDTGVRSVQLRLMGVNPVQYRASENSLFTGTLFNDLFPADVSFRIRPYGFQLPFTLSSGAGLKTVHVQTNSATGTTGPDVTVTFNYITDGPVVTAFSLVEGQTVSRPLVVSGSATAALGVKWIDLLIDGVLVARNSAATFATLWDSRSLGNGMHRAELRARDQAGNESSRAVNIVTAPAPPPAPVIAAPLDGLLTNAATVALSGTAEAGIGLRVTRNGSSVSGSLNAAPDGSFNLPAVPLVEGTNTLVVTAFDGLGSSSSAPVGVVHDSGPPAAPVLLEPVYSPSRGLQLEWQYAASGERPTKFRVLWKHEAFSDPAQASGQSDLISGRTTLTIGSMPDATWYFAVVGYDDSGNASVLSNLRSAVLDFTKPSFTISYDGSIPVGPRTLGIILTSSEPLTANPVLTISAAGSGEPVSVPVIRQSATVFTAAFVVSDLSATTGTATVNVSATDLVGNSFSGPPSGPDLVFDVTKPTATLSLDHPAPVQTLNPVSVALGLQLSEAPALGTSPTLAFDPPVGARVVIALTGSGTVWTGNLTLNAAMGRGTGFFRLSVTDAAGNSGTVITPSNLEIYNTELPDPPTRPGGLSAQTLAHGHIAIRWDAVPRAESYKIYREPGNNATVPVLLLADGLNACEFTDTPPADGIYTYAIVAALRGADSLPSGVLNALSDRTPPPAPEDFVATLGATGVALSWAAPSSGEVPHHYNVYRGAELIYSSTTPVSFQDNPPRGIHDYRVSSVDSHGNENATPVLTIEMLVSPVTNLQILVRDASPTSMTWDSTDPTVTGFNVYRNGVKQNGGPIPLADRFYIDPLTLGVASVSYEITALNAARNESPRRRLVVVAADFSLLLNPDAAAAEHDSVRFYFDSLRVVATNLAVSGRLAIEHLDLVRTVGGSDALSVGIDTNLDVAPGGSASQDFVVLAPRTLATQQSIQLLARGPADASGSRVSFEKSFVKRPATDGGNSASLQPVTPPLAGGLTDFVARIANPGPVPIEIIIGRGFGNLAGDVSVRVLDASGAEVSRKDFKGSGVSGVTMDGNGNAFITIAPGGSVSFTIPQIFVPEALGHAGQGARFVLDIAAIRYRPLSGSLLAGGTLSGQTSSSLVQTPYYGTSATNKAFYANDEPVHITGQAIDRASGLPLAHAALHLGFGARGFVTWQTVTTDDLGAYAYDYTPVLGFSGRLNIWAAHPDVVDQLNQVTIDYRRLYVTPGRGDVVMSKNDTLDITLKAINPGDLTAASVAMSARAFVMNGDTEVDITTIRAALIDGPFAIAPNGDQNVAIRFTADANAPDTALINLTFLSAEGASCTFRGTLSLRPAVPVLSFVSPRVGYVEGSVNRGNINSYVVTLENLGLRAVENPVLIPPASMRWMDVNLPRAADGRVVLPDIPVGGRLTFGVAFAPPDTTALGFYDDFIEIQGSNLQTPFHVNLFAQVTSSLVGSVKFVVDNIFVERVPNAKVRLRNPNLREELGPFLTDSNGEVTIPNLQEGSWSWQITAAGHSTQTGTVDIVPGQLGLVETRLSKSLVTVEFSVVPKPFTDRYEIVIEQTFETRVPFPVLVFDPPSFAFTNLPDQYESTLLVKVRNEGLISMFDVQLTGDVSSYASLQPLINYLPELHAQEEVVVPFHLVWSRHGLGGGGSGPVLSSDLGGAISGCADAVFKPNILDDDFMAGINAIGRAIAQCADGATAALICSLIVTIDTLDFIMGFTGLEAIAETIGKFLGCIVAQYKSDVPTGIGGGGGGGGNGSFTGSGCFPAGTPVTLGDGSRVAIESLQRGTAVRSSMWAGHCGQVEDVIIRHSNDLRELSFCEVRPGTTPLAPADLRLKITGEHLVWNDASGWTAAANLKPGDWVHHESGALLAVVSNVSQPGEHTVYTIEVKGGNAFFASGIMVQDLCGAQKLGDRSALAPNSQPATVPAR